MSKPKSGVFHAGDEGGIVYEHLNDGETEIQPEYASVTAPGPVECSVEVDGNEVDHVYAGIGSHSWWTAAGGRLLRYPLHPGQKLTVRLTGKGSFRIGWYE